MNTSQYWFSTASGADLGDEIAQSLRFDSNGYLYRNQISPNLSGNRTFTFSTWFKHGDMNETQIFGIHPTSGNDNWLLGYTTSNQGFAGRDGSQGYVNYNTVRKYRDPNAWYHLFLTCSSGVLTLYVNGEQGNQTMTQNHSMDRGFYIGSEGGGGTAMDGYLAETYFIQGTVLHPVNDGFIRLNENGVYVPDTPTISSYGTNGFFMLKNDNSVNDQSGNSNNFTSAGTITKSEDSPSNVYATFNSLHNHFEQGSYAYGNNQFTSGGSNRYTHNNSTLGMTKGKFYAEFKWVSPSSRDVLVGITDRYTTDQTHELGHRMEDKGYRFNGDLRYNNGNVSSWGASYGTGDVVMVALDLDNNCVYFGVNGTWSNSGDPTSGASKTGGQAISGVASAHDGCYYFAASVYDDNSAVWQANFGNGYFGTTAVSSAGTNASNIGIFEYDVPTGYTALSTKGLNE